MKTRIAIVVGLLAGFASGVGGAQALGESGAKDGGYWACVVVRTVDAGVCVDNPLPPRLPEAEKPDKPELPS